MSISRNTWDTTFYLKNSTVLYLSTMLPISLKLCTKRLKTTILLSDRVLLLMISNLANQNPISTSVTPHFSHFQQVLQNVSWRSLSPSTIWTMSSMTQLALLQPYNCCTQHTNWYFNAKCTVFMLLAFEFLFVTLTYLHTHIYVLIYMNVYILICDTRGFVFKTILFI